MSTNFLTSVLDDIQNAARINRNKAANIVLESPELLEELIAMTFEVNHKRSIKAAWVLEWICTHHDLDYLLPHLDIFCTQLHQLQFDSAVRPCAKICEQLAKAYNAKKQNLTKTSLKDSHIDLIITTGFDWLLGQHKAAVKAYTMTSLYELGKHRAWVHPELKHLIASSLIHENKACMARGRHLLALLNS